MLDHPSSHYGQLTSINLMVNLGLVLEQEPKEKLTIDVDYGLALHPDGDRSSLLVYRLS
jgi:hypothetical protein